MAYNIISIIIAVSLGILSWIDIKKREIPSFLTTTLIFIVCVLKIENLEYGIYSLLFSIMLFELSYIKGLADIKIITLIGLTVNTFTQFSVMMILIMGLGVVWQGLFIVPILNKHYKKDKNIWERIKKVELPFIPVLAITYIILKIIF